MIRSRSSTAPGVPRRTSVISGEISVSPRRVVARSASARALARAIRSLITRMPPATTTSTSRATARNAASSRGGREARAQRSQDSARRGSRSRPGPSGSAPSPVVELRTSALTGGAEELQFLGLDHGLELRADAELGVQRLHVAAAGLQRDAQHSGDRLDLHAVAE